MLQLVKNTLSVKAPGQKKRERAIVRRAIFVCNHPELGWSVLDRSFFVRRFTPGSNLDECKKDGNLLAKAEKTLTQVFRQSGVGVLSRGEMFQMRGLGAQIKECTPFVFDFNFTACYEKIPVQRCIPLEHHPLRQQIRQSLSRVVEEMREVS